MTALAERSPWFRRHPRLTLSVFSMLLCLVAVLLEERSVRAYYADWASPKDWEKFWTYDELLGWSQSPGQRGRFDHRDFSVEVVVNSRGLRDDEYPLERTAKKRMLVLGDSFGWGWGVEHHERFSEILEKSHPDWEIINASVPGYGTVQELLYLEARGLSFKPDVVLLLVCDNDFTDNADGGGWYFKPHAVMNQGELKIRNIPVPRSTLKQRVGRFLRARTSLGTRLYAAWRAVPGLLRTSPGEQPAMSGGDAPETPALDEIMTHLIKTMNERCKASGALLAVVSIRGPRQRTGPLHQVSAAEHIPYLPLDPYFISAETRTSFPHDLHWNAKGHELAASAIGAFLLTDGVPEAETMERWSRR